MADQRRKRSPIGTAHNNPPTWDFQCPKCKRVYHSPIYLIECTHKCTPASRSVRMLPVTKDDNED